MPAKHLLQKTRSPAWFGTEYNLNLYRGCCHGCIYCDSRSECYRIDDFDRVRAKENAIPLLRQELAAKRQTGVVSLGAMSDSYNPFEEGQRLTRQALGLFLRHGFGAAIATKSDLITRDRALLAELSAQAPVIVKFSLSTADEGLAARVEPRAPSPARRLRALEQLAGRPLVKGIRRLIQTENSESFCRIPALTQALRRLPELGLTFDLGIHTGQFYDVVRLAEACPETRFVVDHLGKPDIRGGRLAEWKDEMRALCQCENVWCKVSSLATEADHHHWTLEEVRPYAEWAFECFGFRRVMFGGDWPVSSQAASYPICVDTLLRILQGATEAEKRAFFRENAEQFYGI